MLGPDPQNNVSHYSAGLLTHLAIVRPASNVLRLLHLTPETVEIKCSDRPYAARTWVTPSREPSLLYLNNSLMLHKVLQEEHHSLYCNNIWVHQEHRRLRVALWRLLPTPSYHQSRIYLTNVCNLPPCQRLWPPLATWSIRPLLRLHTSVHLFPYQT